MTQTILKLAVVFVGQSVLAWAFYWSRLLLRDGIHPNWTDSDFTVFILPLVIGFALSALIIFPIVRLTSFSKRMAATFGLAAIGALISSFISIVMAFNLYGT